MNYRQKKITKLAKKEFDKYHKDLYDEHFEKADAKNFIKLKEGKSFAGYFDNLKTYPYFKRKISKQLRKENK